VDDLSYYSSDDYDSDSEEYRALTIKLGFRNVSDRIDSMKCLPAARLTTYISFKVSLKTMYKAIHKFPDPKYKFNLKARGLTTPEKFVVWWNENHPDCQITVDSIEEWTYREGEDPSRYNVHWSEYGE